MSDYKPTSPSGWGVQPIEKNPNGQDGDIHDTFKVDREGNVTEGHTTGQLPGGKSVRMNWGEDRK